MLIRWNLHQKGVFRTTHHLPCYCVASSVFICKSFHLLRPLFVFTSDKHTLKAVHYLWIRLNSGKATLKAGTEATADETGTEETGSASKSKALVNKFAVRNCDSQRLKAYNNNNYQLSFPRVQQKCSFYSACRTMVQVTTTVTTDYSKRDQETDTKNYILLGDIIICWNNYKASLLWTYLKLLLFTLCWVSRRVTKESLVQDYRKQFLIVITWRIDKKSSCKSTN